MIKAKNLYFRYEDKFILKNINLNIEKGSFTAIIGSNGSGKTTLAKHFNALLLPTKGEVFVDGISTKKDAISMRKKVGFIFQNPEDQLVHSIVEEDTAFGLENLEYPIREIKSTVKETLAKLKIPSLAKENVNILSAGQKQLVALAGVLAMNPEVIILDEPTTVLDIKNKKNIMGIIKAINKEGKTIVMITNTPNDLIYCDNVIALRNGRVIFNDKRNKLKKYLLDY